MAQYKSYTHVLRIDKDEVQGILCGDVVVTPKLYGTNACLFMKDGTVHAGSRTREINMNKDNANFCKTLTLNGEKEFPQIIKHLESHPDHIVYGEWLGADGERFPGHIKDYLNHGFFIFDVFDTTADKYIPYDTYKSEFGNYDKIIPVIGTFHNVDIHHHALDKMAIALINNNTNFQVSAKQHLQKNITASLT